jgi:hypothetical protein
LFSVGRGSLCTAAAFFIAFVGGVCPWLFGLRYIAHAAFVLFASPKRTKKATSAQSLRGFEAARALVCEQPLLPALAGFRTHRC